MLKVLSEARASIIMSCNYLTDFLKNYFRIVENRCFVCVSILIGNMFLDSLKHSYFSEPDLLVANRVAQKPINAYPRIL